MSITKQKHLLKSTLESFRKFGPRAVTMDDIANRAGVSKKTLYLYFRDKNTLVDTLYTKVIDVLDWRIKNVVAGKENTVQQYIKFIELGLIGQTYLNALTVDDLKRSFPGVYMKIQYFIEYSYAPALSRGIEEGIKQGFYIKEFDTRLLVEICLSHLKFFMQRTDGHLPEISVNKIKKQVIRHLVGGMATPAGKKKVRQYLHLTNKNQE